MNDIKMVHLGCGSKILKGWINIDSIEGENILKHDLRKPLPFNDNSINFFFSEHFFEHLKKGEGIFLLKEIYRCLKQGGINRMSVPDLDYLIKNYLDNNLDAYSRVGFKPKTRCDMLNEGIRRWNHQYLYNKDELMLVQKEAGFSSVSFVKHKVSNYNELNNIETRVYTNEIVCEAIKL